MVLCSPLWCFLWSFAVLCGVSYGPLQSFVVLCDPLRSFAVFSQTDVFRFRFAPLKLNLTLTLILGP